MIRRVALLGLCLLTGIAAFGVRAASPEDDPQLLVHDTIEELRAAVLNDKEAVDSDPNHALSLVDRIVSPHVDTTRAGRLILGKHWRTMTPAQRDRFIELYKRLLLRTYAVHVGDYTDVVVDYLPTLPAGESREEVVVRTRVSRPMKDTVDMNYRMSRVDDRWMVYDVIGNGVSIVVSFRSAVDAEIGQFGVDGLLSRLEEKVSRPIAK
jgi:phospholipid transport system substrate-binding protein